MRNALIALATCSFAAPVGAQLTTTYTGIQRLKGKEYPASAIFAIDQGRIAMILKGARNSRMLFDEKQQILRIISEDDKQYIDLGKDWQGNMDPNGQMAKMQKQLDAMPKEQRAMAEGMMKQAMAGMAAAQDPLTYNWTKDKKTISGYECTLVEGIRRAMKVTEYCGSTSDDFKMSERDHQTVLDMQGFLRNFLITVKSADDATRAFTWDTSVDGYPVLTRCFNNGEMTLELTLATVTRHGPTDEQFGLPSEYKKMDMQKPSRGGM
jgi:hypothetical protein